MADGALWVKLLPVAGYMVGQAILPAGAKGRVATDWLLACTTPEAFRMEGHPTHSNK